MYTQLKGFLAKWHCDEAAAAIMEALTTLERHGQVTIAYDINGLIDSATDTPVPEILDAINHLIDIAQQQVLTAHSIVCNSGRKMVTDILDGLLALDHYSDSDAITVRTDHSDDPIETLSELLSLVSHHQPTHFIFEFESVSPSLIERIGARHHAQLVLHADAPTPIDRDWITRIKSFATTYPSAIAVGYLLNEGVQPGQVADMLFRRAADKLNVLEPSAPDQAAIDVMGLLLISDLGPKLTTVQVRDRLDSVYSDVSFITLVTMAIDNVYSGVMR